MRAIYLFLLALGILAFILPLINPALFIPDGEEGLRFYEEVIHVPGRYTLPVIFSVLLLITPVIVGLWSLSWAMQDAGLMHYKFYEEDNRLYEIEPIHIHYQSFLKGYAGISSIFFLVQLIITWASVTEEVRTSDVLMSIFLPLFIIVLALPAYIVYAKFSHVRKHLREDLGELKNLSKEDVLKS